MPGWVGERRRDGVPAIKNDRAIARTAASLVLFAVAVAPGRTAYVTALGPLGAARRCLTAPKSRFSCPVAHAALVPCGRNNGNLGPLAGDIIRRRWLTLPAGIAHKRANRAARQRARFSAILGLFLGLPLAVRRAGRDGVKRGSVPSGKGS